MSPQPLDSPDSPPSSPSLSSSDPTTPSSSSSSTNPMDPSIDTLSSSLSTLSTTTKSLSTPSIPLLHPPPLLPRATAPPLLARRPAGPGVGLRAGVRGVVGGGGGMKIPPSLQAKMAALASRSSSTASASSSSSSPSTTPTPSSPSPQLAFNPSVPSQRLQPPLGGRRRPGLTLAAMGISSSSVVVASDSEGEGERGEVMGKPSGGGNEGTGTPFSNFSKIVDPSGRLSFESKAVLHSSGVDFSSGASFKIKMDDFEIAEELGKGNYGTVKKVLHSPTGVVMALKEIRLELDDSKLKTIITELDILHRATSPYIIDFYGAFFIESCVYYCMEYMDAGSLEKVSGCDVGEGVLARVTRDVVRGLKFLKDELKIMHRDVKPTNVLINRKGFVKLCDFGVSGQLDRSLAKTNIGCQSYMAPERIKGESMGSPTSYTASSDVWSLGLSVIEFAIGHYPYPPETYSNVFAQLTAIVHGDPPCLPGLVAGAAEGEWVGEERVGKVGYSETAREFVGACLRKQAKERPTYAELLEHPFLKADEGRDVDVAGWINRALAFREQYPRVTQVALA